MPIHALTLAADQQTIFALVVLIVLVLLFLVLSIIVIGLLRPWMLATMAGCQLSAARLMGMRLRRVNVAEVVQCGVMCHQAGYPVGWDELERAALQGVDLEKVTLAYIKSQREELGYTFGNLVDADRDHRLAEMLQERG
ncbi:flotillin-like FloA family protein [Aeoliella sp. ICT_H6.2]|uniref:Flotillin-like FloA family protein n=1 Tax=Aeoliella straminimaris TaxID=2954799 RepID=A0A9X2JH56_9BACT|nr:flotillin-like FloA family protein [Aeoliella straminimaris]MCO6045700.1 flotillin-like FloA family protein [Aeoliella straminimaris]